MNNSPLLPSRPTTPYLRPTTACLLLPQCAMKIQGDHQNSHNWSRRSETLLKSGRINNKQSKMPSSYPKSNTTPPKVDKATNDDDDEKKNLRNAITYMLPEAELNADKAPATLVTLLATPPPPLLLPPLAVLLVLGSSFRVIVNRIIWIYWEWSNDIIFCLRYDTACTAYRYCAQRWYHTDRQSVQISNELVCLIRIYKPREIFDGQAIKTKKRQQSVEITTELVCLTSHLQEISTDTLSIEWVLNNRV